MNFKKIFAFAAAAAVAASAMSVASFAIDFGSSEPGEWDSGNFDATNEVLIANEEFDTLNAMIGVDTVRFYATVTDLDNGHVNGVFSTNSGGGKWQQIGFGGTEEDWTEVTLEEVGSFTVDVPIGIDNDTWFFIGWGTSYDKGVFSLESVEFIKNGEAVVSWDSNGYKLLVEPEKTDDVEPAPADTEAPAVTEAPSTGDTTTTTNDKTSADTGVEGVAIVAGIAIVAAGAVVVAKKRK